VEAIWDHGPNVLAHVAMGIGLAASAGLRAFLPLLVVGLAGRLDVLPLSDSFGWLESWPALLVFGAAVLVEVLADKIPLVDHFLDTAQIFVKPIAGALVMATVVSEWSPLYVTVLSIALGGTAAATVHVTKAKLRLASSVATAGLGNPVLSLSEDVGAVAGTVGAIFVPGLVLVAFVLFAVLAWITLRRLRRRPA